MPIGIVKFFNAPKGFGFITLEEGGKEVFLPSSSLRSAGISNLQMGQRVSFELEADTKGPKAISIALIESAPQAKIAKAQPHPVHDAEKKSGITFYSRLDSDQSQQSLSALRARGVEPRIVNVIESPPSRNELIRLSRLLRESEQSLMRKYDPLFRELRLDDRFISENEIWDAIVEHPSLIDGPVLATTTSARICRSNEEVVAFLEGRPPRKFQRAASAAVPESAKTPSSEKARKRAPANEAVASPQSDRKSLAARPKTVANAKVKRTKPASKTVAKAKATPAVKKPAKAKLRKASPTTSKQRPKKSAKALVKKKR